MLDFAKKHFQPAISAKTLLDEANIKINSDLLPTTLSGQCRHTSQGNMYLVDHILVVEDDADQVAIIEEGLRWGRAANPVSSVGSSDEAIAYLNGDGPFQNRSLHPLPSLILLDLKLPGPSGFMVLEWLRNQPKFKKLPVIVLTGSADQADIEKAYALGANSYLPKPYQITELRALVKAIDKFWVRLAQKPSC